MDTEELFEKLTTLYAEYTKYEEEIESNLAKIESKGPRKLYPRCNSLVRGWRLSALLETKNNLLARPEDPTSIHQENMQCDQEQ